MDEQKLRQLFKNRSNCYADADEVIQAMDEDCFIETVNEALRQPPVAGRSEQLCGLFEADSKTSSATKCKCGREKWEHPKAT